VYQTANGDDRIEDAMHPLFVELFIDTDERERQADEERHRARRTRRSRSRMAITVRSRTIAPMPRGSSG
jgi:hypothetical protein